MLADSLARRKRFGWGSLGALERAKRARAATWERVQQAYSGGYEHPIEVGGAVFTPLVL